jgi:hypothetical protein
MDELISDLDKIMSDERERWIGRVAQAAIVGFVLGAIVGAILW